MRHRISAGALVEEDGRILVVRHVRPQFYDFWVAPGGGAKDEEELAAAAMREVREESGLDVAIGQLVYVEELLDPNTRHCKFWFTARLVGGALRTDYPAAVSEHIVEAAWLSRPEMEGRIVYPPVLAGRYWEDKARGFPGVGHLGLRRMAFW